jgi:polyisoprenoid-binding protein YceI
MAIHNKDIRSPTVWSIDPASTTIEFGIKVLGLKTVKGRFTRVTGSVLADNEDLSASKVRVVIDAASIATGIKRRDTHLRSADFLDAAQYPTITFQSSRVEEIDERRLRVTGDLTVHGSVQQIVLDMSIERRSPEGSTLTGRGTLDRRAAGVAGSRMMEAVLGNVLAVTLQVELHRPGDRPL